LAGSKRRSRKKKTTIKDNTFRMPTLLRGEDAKAFHKLSERINKTVKPVDALEEMWVADVIYLQWELQRLQESKAQFIHLKFEESIGEVLSSVIGPVAAQRIVLDRKIGEDGAQEQLEKIFEAAELSQSTVVAQTIVLYLDEIERLDRMILSAEVRRNNAIREVRSHREALARSLRRACEEVEDVEFREIPAANAARPAAASIREQIQTKANLEEPEDEEDAGGEMTIGYGDD